MSSKQKILEMPVIRSKTERPSLLNIHALQQAAVRLADLRRAGSSLNTRDLVALLICHAARSRRASMPFAPVHLNASDPFGKSAIRLNFH
ncbi:hypothetical protein ATN84_08300 [Paramesorhizobium deserti]|uniref:Uncharacterized protein n=1 Tax=Paramesorhizobium deserti TaxID=1494590 RepID=A0A135HW44_9HYPH|nr:hypothetical protein [Paramesorhizobium deserti]KXF77381.1 hypothetical protein ATN84_08300 [Paramesorhizobium deserti]